MNRTHLQKLLTVLIAGTLAGSLLGLAALPAALVFDVGLRTVSDVSTELPPSLLRPLTAQRSHLYANDGTLITTFYLENRVDVPLRDVAPVMRQAIVAAEDARFYEHNGVDLRGVVRAFVANRSGGTVRQGASTLTMQYIRNVLGTDPTLTERQRVAATEVTTARKLREIRYALALERKLDKDAILNRYLNIAYFGAGAYGIAAASRRYFSKAPAQLTLAEAALLAGLVRSPDTDDPINGDADAARARRGYVLDQMAATGMIPPAAADEARSQPLNLRPTREVGGCTALTAAHRDWGFFCDWFEQWWKAQPVFGDSAQERQRALRRGGFTIVTSLDPAVQAAAQREVARVHGYSHPHAVPTAVVQPGTGRVLAMAVNRQYSLDRNPPGQKNRPNTVNQLVAGGEGIEGYQAASTFKVFTMLAALEAGLSLDTPINAPTRVLTRYPVTGSSSCGGFWCPVNANPSWMDGVHTMWTSFGRSVNTYFVQLAERIGMDRVVEMAQRLGIVFRVEEDARLARHGARQWGPFTLGVSATTPLDLANAYATLAADGRYCAPLPVLSVTDRAGRPVAGVGPSCRQVLDPDIARAATDAARCPVGDRSAYGRCDGGTAPTFRQLVGRPVAGKTGSSERNATEVMVAYTPQLAVASIAANPDDPADPVGLSVQAKVIEAVGRVIVEALRDEPVRDFAPPSREVAFGSAAGAPAWRASGDPGN